MATATARDLRLRLALSFALISHRRQRQCVRQRTLRMTSLWPWRVALPKTFRWAALAVALPGSVSRSRDSLSALPCAHGRLAHAPVPPHTPHPSIRLDMRARVGVPGYYEHETGIVRGQREAVRGALCGASFVLVAKATLPAVELALQCGVAVAPAARMRGTPHPQIPAGRSAAVFPTPAVPHPQRVPSFEHPHPHPQSP